MGVTFTNTPAGKATIAKKVTADKGNTVISDTQEEEQVQMPGSAGPTIGFDDAMEGGMTTLQQAAPLKPYGEVTFTAGFTKGLPNYSAARADISLKLPCTTDEIDEAYEFAENWVSTRLQKLHEEL